MAEINCYRVAILFQQHFDMTGGNDIRKVLKKLQDSVVGVPKDINDANGIYQEFVSNCNSCNIMLQPSDGFFRSRQIN